LASPQPAAAWSAKANIAASAPESNMQPKTKNIKVPESTHAALKSVVKPTEKLAGVAAQMIERGVKLRQKTAKK
jgi:hypothetical protein